MLITAREKLPTLVRLFCIYLVIMLPVMVIVEFVYALLSDDWSFGFRNSHVSSALGYVLFFILAGQHMYRIFTIAALLRRAQFSVANAKAYLIVSFAVIVLCALSMAVSLSPSTRLLQFSLDGMALPGGLLGFALTILLAWWILLSTSEKVRAFENAGRTR